jgi:uncharacterized protein YegL
MSLHERPNHLQKLLSLYYKLKEDSKMKKDLTELVFILDKSGSMSGLETDTIGGYNAMMKKQQEEEGVAVVTTVLFDNNYQLLHDRINIKEILPLTSNDYYVEGATALLDAIGKTINKIIGVQKSTSEEHRANKVLFVITTDGMENASQEYTVANIKKMIERQTKRYNWEFIFLGANIDAVATASDYGIRADRAANYQADSKGTILNYETVSDAISEFRTERGIKPEWKKQIDNDFKERS